MIVLALESSTSSAKAILYDTACGVRAVKTIPYPAAACAGGVSDTDAIAALTLQAGAEIAAGRGAGRRGLRYVAQHRTLRGFALEARKGRIRGTISRRARSAPPSGRIKRSRTRSTREPAACPM